MSHDERDATGSGASALANTSPVTDPGQERDRCRRTINSRGSARFASVGSVRSPPPWRSLCQVSRVQCFCRCTQQVGDFLLGEFCYAHFLNAVHD